MKKLIKSTRKYKNLLKREKKLKTQETISKKSSISVMRDVKKSKKMKK